MCYILFYIAVSCPQLWVDHLTFTLLQNLYGESFILSFITINLNAVNFYPGIVSIIVFGVRGSQNIIMGAHPGFKPSPLVCG